MNISANNIKNEDIQNLIDFLDMYIVTCTLALRDKYEVNYKITEQDITEYKKQYQITLKHIFKKGYIESPVKSIKIFISEEENKETSYKFVIDLSGLWKIDGNNIRKKLLEKNITQYKRRKTGGLIQTITYSIQLENLNQVQDLFRVFNQYLPK